VSGPTKAYLSKEWGVNGNTVLATVPGFEITKSFFHDPMHDILEGVARYELRAMLQRFIVTTKYFKLEELNSRITNFEYTTHEAQGKPQVLGRRSFEPGSTLCQSAASMKTLMTLLPCLIGDKIPEFAPYWENYLRLLTMLQSVSAVVSTRTVQTLEVLIAKRNEAYCKLYPDEPIRPKFHYFFHYPDQIIMYGPMRNHWCMGYESNSGFLKQKHWYKFHNLPKSLAVYHQQWMCLNMSG
jgi:hypothetical protein